MWAKYLAIRITTNLITNLYVVKSMIIFAYLIIIWYS